MDRINRIASYTASGVFPVKLLQDKLAISEGKILPRHLQLNPTNQCDLNCSFCSCSDRVKGLELSFDEIKDILYTFKLFGTVGLTITGGGEPLLHPNINEILDLAKKLNIKTGLVTNGLKIDRLKSGYAQWIRVSYSDERDCSDSFLHKLSNKIIEMPHINWAFSYVLTRKPQWDKLTTIIAFSAKHNFSHARLVDDILDAENVPDISESKQRINGVPGENLVIYQSRKQFTIGRKRCLISLLKPSIGADGKIYPCCGTQYALENAPRDYAETMQMGHWKEFINILIEQKHFDGSVCAKCYYEDYNRLLELLITKLEHKEFV